MKYRVTVPYWFLEVFHVEAKSPEEAEAHVEKILEGAWSTAETKEYAGEEQMGLLDSYDIDVEEM